MKTLAISAASALLVLSCSSSSPPPQQRTSVLKAITADTAPTNQTAAGTMMKTFETPEGFKLSGGEYWPYVGTADARYPEDVMWGFYPKKGEMPPGETDPNPDTASKAAVACAERAYGELQKFLAAPANRPKDFDLVVEEGKDQGVTRLFYLWTNDYTKAADPFPPGVRPGRLWYWKRKTPDPKRPAGYWKWESTLTQKGECKTPNLDEAATYLREKRDELAKNKTTATQ